MAASGGGAIVPTNWTGLLVTVVLVAVVAVATYFAVDTMATNKADAAVDESSKEITVEQIFSATARRTLAPAETTRAEARVAVSGPATSADDAPIAAQTLDDDWESEDEMSAEEDQLDDYEDALEGAEEFADDDYAAEPEPAATPAATPRPAAPVARRAPEPEPTVRPPEYERPPAEALEAWWRNDDPDAFAARYVGVMDRGFKPSDAIAIMFSEPVAPDEAQRSISLTNAAGRVLPAVWKTSENPRLIFVEGLAPGRYRVAIASGLKSKLGSVLGTGVAGPVFVY